MGGLHDVLPDHGRVGASVDLTFGSRRDHGDLGFRKADPDGRCALWRIAGEDGIGIVLGGPGLTGRWAALQLGPPAGALVDGSLEDPGQLIG